VDRLVHNSSTLGDIKQTFFNGDPEYFREQLREWVRNFGISAEDLKNLTLSALLAKMIAMAGDGPLQKTIRSSLKLATGAGLAARLAAAVLAEDQRPQARRGAPEVGMADANGPE